MLPYFYVKGSGVVVVG